MHKPVLLQEAIESLEIDPRGTYVDCTLGDGGHSFAIFRKLRKGKLISIDVDLQAIDLVRSKYTKEIAGGSWDIVRGNFADLEGILTKLHINKVDGILFDLGMSSRQLCADKQKRGFSYESSDPLDMRMDMRLGVTAEDLLKALGQSELEKLFTVFGEERYAKRIAREIKDFVKNDHQKTITADVLAALVRKVVPAGYRKGSKHPARRVFQALRIAVNDELRSLQMGLSSALSVVSSGGGRIVVISYHSLEDRIVKLLFSESARTEAYRLISKKPIVPSTAEISANPRAHSAKMRIIEKI